MEDMGMNINNKIEYYLNAIFYTLCEIDRKFCVLTRRFVSGFISLLALILVTKKHKEAFNQFKSKRELELDDFFYDDRYGTVFVWAQKHFTILDMGYYSFFSIILSFIVYMTSSYEIFFYVTFITPWVVGYIIEHKMVFKDDRYLSYFKSFKTKNARWHKKWLFLTIGFIAGSILSVVLGMLSCNAIGKYLKEFN